MNRNLQPIEPKPNWLDDDFFAQEFFKQEFFGSVFLNNTSYSYKRLKRGSCPPEFARLLIREKLDYPNRYSDILGSDAKLACSVLPWRYISRSISVGVMAPSGSLASIAYATLVRLNDSSELRTNSNSTAAINRTAVNLSYAVSAHHEGQGLAFLASCLVIKLASKTWPTLDARHDVNIQTKESNAASKSLAARLQVLPCAQADFLVVHPDSSVHRYVGFRSSWTAMVTKANDSLCRMSALANFESEGAKDTSGTSESSDLNDSHTFNDTTNDIDSQQSEQGPSP